jgi:hypothetical protein
MPGSMHAVTACLFGKCDFLVKVEVYNDEFSLKTDPLLIATVH